MKIFKYLILIFSVSWLMACGDNHISREPPENSSELTSSGDYTPPMLAGENVWMVDYADSQLGFTGFENGKAFDGIFSDFKAAILLDPEDLPSAYIGILINIASVDARSDSRNSTLSGKDWFDVRQYPDAQFTSHQITHISGDSYRAYGVLSLKAMSKDLILDFTLNITGDKAFAQGHTTLDRRDFDIGSGSYMDDDSHVGFPVTINFTISAMRDA